MDKKTIGPILRRERKKQKLTIEEVVKNLSFEATTLSNLERGFTNVADEKYIEYATLLGIEEELFGIVSEEKRKERTRRRRLKQIEYIASIVPEKALKYLEDIHQEISSNENSSLSPPIYYLKGICYFKQKEWKLSEEHFLTAIEITDHFEELEKSNIKSASYNYLSAICYHKNDLVRALEYSNKGIDQFDIEGDRLNQYYLLLLNKPTYLEEMNENEKALQALRTLEKKLLDSKNTDIYHNIRTTIILQMYNLYTIIYKNLGFYEEALSHANKGIHIAWINKKYDYLFSIWTTVGMIYYSLGDTVQAKSYYQLALDIEHEVKNEKRLSYTFTNLSEMLLYERKIEKSKKFATKAVEISKKGPRKLDYVQSLLSLGKWYLAQNEFQNALSILLEAEKLAVKHQFKKEEETIVTLIGTCYKQLNDQGNFIKYLEKLYDLHYTL